tara:strand:+ start:2920 stop:3498 length:579 start_codon:yes stop_codon:yes gene_type:complete
MINSELGHVKTLKEFNKSIREQQEEAHGEDYCAIHDAIKKYMKECKSYMELGTHQGGTASVAMLANPNRVYLVDIDFTKYNLFLKPIAEEYCEKKDIELIVNQTDSTGFGAINMTDMLVIDSYHHPAHMQKELDMHGSNVRKYLIAHDTSNMLGKPDERLYHCMKNWCNKNNFVEVERGTTNVGYTVFKKTI